MGKFRVLSLDGGGVRGYLTICILEKLEKNLQIRLNDNKSIDERFDLIVGTSTGGIIAAGLSIGMSVSEIKALYENILPKLFKPISKGILKPKYNHNLLKNELQKYLKDKTFNDVKTDLILVSVDISTGTPRFFKSPFLDKYKSRADEKLIDGVLATSAAPVFFPLVNTKYSSYLTDGGFCANNPSLVGLMDALEKVKDIEKISLLSIGTGSMKFMPYDIEKIKQNGGLYNWVLNSNLKINNLVIPIIEVMLNSQSILIEKQMRILLKENYFRINPILTQNVNLDDYKKIDFLKNLANEADKDFVIKKVIKILN